MDKLKPAAFVLLTLALASPVRAQVVELSAGAGTVRIEGGGDLFPHSVLGPAVDAAAAVALNDRFSVETFVTYGRRSISIAQYGPGFRGGDTQLTEGVYGVLIRQRVIESKASGFRAFVSYGLGGLYYREYIPTKQYVGGRTPITFPESTRSETRGLWYPVAGFGVQKSLGDHLAVRGDAQVTTFFGIPLGGRGSVGIVVPIGRRPARP